MGFTSNLEILPRRLDGIFKNKGKIFSGMLSAICVNLFSLNPSSPPSFGNITNSQWKAA